MIVDIDAFPFYCADDHTKVDYSHYGLELALYSLNTKKKKTWHFLSNFCNGMSLQSL